MTINPRRTFWLMALLIGVLVLAACTRSASDSAIPTTAPDAGQATPDGAGGGSEQPTADPNNPGGPMDAVGTAVRETQTAQAGGGVPGDATPIPPADTPVPGTGPQATPVPVLPPETPVPTMAPLPAGQVCANPYTVVEGDWIYKIARACQLTPDAIIAANPGINKDRLSPGQKLNLPGASVPPVPDQKCIGTHTVVKGETLFGIGYACGFTVEEMALANNIRYPFTIYPGDVLKFP